MLIGKQIYKCLLKLVKSNTYEWIGSICLFCLETIFCSILYLFFVSSYNWYVYVYNLYSMTYDIFTENTISNSWVQKAKYWISQVKWLNLHKFMHIVTI